MTKTKRQLRAEAVERLNDMVLDTGSAVKKLAIALDVKWNPDNSPASMSRLQNRIADLLTDDDTHESREGYEERMYDVPVSDCPYCGCDRVVIHEYNDMYERPHSYRVEHVDEKEAFNCDCFESYYGFDSIEKAVQHADMRGGERNEHPKQMYVSGEDFEWLQEQLDGEPTNGIGGETNGIHDGITLPEGDAVAILRKAAKCTSVNTSVGDVLRYNVPGNEPSAWQTAEDACEALADMVERDYVSREKYENTVKMCNGMHSDVMHVAELQEQVDVLRDQLDTMRDVAREFRDERDGWKAKAEAKSAKRAAAVERLKNSKYHTALDDVCAMLGWGHEPHFEGATDALIDLLTDEDGLRSNDGATNIEWYAKNDLRKLCDLGIDGNISCDDCPNQCVETEEGTPPEECQRRLLEWLMAPHEDAHSKAQSKTEPNLSEQSESLSDAISENLGLSQDFEIDSREKLEAKVTELQIQLEAMSDVGE